MSAKGYSPERAALILADAVVMGDAGAAAKWETSLRTIKRYRARAQRTPELARDVARVSEGHTKTLATLRVEYMRDALEVMRQKLADAELDEIATSIKIVGELHQVAVAVAAGEDDDDERPARADSEAAQDAGGLSNAPTAH